MIAQGEREAESALGVGGEGLVPLVHGKVRAHAACGVFGHEGRTATCNNTGVSTCLGRMYFVKMLLGQLGHS